MASRGFTWPNAIAAANTAVISPNNTLFILFYSSVSMKKIMTPMQRLGCKTALRFCFWSFAWNQMRLPTKSGLKGCFYTKKEAQAEKRVQKALKNGKNGGGGLYFPTNADSEEAIMVIIFFINPRFCVSSPVAGLPPPNCGNYRIRRKCCQAGCPCGERKPSRVFIPLQNHPGSGRESAVGRQNTVMRRLCFPFGRAMPPHDGILSAGDDAGLGRDE
jgi:hypothetical protein